MANVKPKTEFEIGDWVMYPSLYGGFVNLFVTGKTKNEILFKERWISEDTWKPCEADVKHRLEVHNGVERFLAWEYKGEECWVQANWKEIRGIEED